MIPTRNDSSHRTGHSADAVHLREADANLLRAVRFDKPDHIPMRYHINDACWHHFPQEELCALIADFPFLFDNAQPPSLPHTPDYLPNARANQPFTDPWGCVWETTDDGIVGSVTKHPLADWDAFEDFTPPDPADGDGMGNYLGSSISQQVAEGCLPRGVLRHGHTFLQLIDLRGYENVMFDMTDGDPRLSRLLEMVEQFNLTLVERDLTAGAKWMGYPEDLGMQSGPMLSPQHFREYILPSYKRQMAPAKRCGAVAHMHCDGQLHTLLDDLLTSGVEVLNLQDLVNGIDWIEQHVKGRVAVDLDIDRQEVSVRGKSSDLDGLIRREVEQLGSREGGLTMIYGLYPGTPLENARAVAEAMHRYAGYYSD